MSDTQNDISNEYFRVIRLRFEEMKRLGEKTIEQLTEEDLSWTPNNHSNSIAIIINHMSGHMVSRWTNVLTSDGEKPFRDRNGEFKHSNHTRYELLDKWSKGWDVFLNELDSLKKEDLLNRITINNQPLTVIEAIEKSLFHYSYHIGQIVYIAKQIKSSNWRSLT